MTWRWSGGWTRRSTCSSACSEASVALALTSATLGCI
jgi:hypothetical protein